ncbi:MAG: hypothetical protein WAT39_09130 [Planctomycetota bacterium]
MERLRYVAAALLLGVVAAVVFMLPLFPTGAPFGPLLPACWRATLPMVPAVAAAAWLVRPLVRLRGRAQLGLTGSLLALAAALLFAFLLLAGGVMLDDGTLREAVLAGLAAAPMGLAMCVVTGYVTLPMGVLFAWLLRPLAGPPPGWSATVPCRRCSAAPGASP